MTDTCEPAGAPIAPPLAHEATDFVLAAKVIAHFEGFLAHAQWDVNAYRMGFGSDTKGAAQAPVHKGDSTTYADALLNLQARIPQYEIEIMRQISAEKWLVLPQNARAGLLSFAYNYGHLTDTLAAVLKDGKPLSYAAKAIEDRETDNHGINAKRRFAEATLLASVE